MLSLLDNHMLNYLCPQFRKISRNTARNDTIRLCQSDKENIKIYFADIPSKIAITTYIWKSSDASSLCITAHNIDAKWVINK